MTINPFLRVLGSADWLPTPDNDGASYTINDEILVDTGWSGAVNLINHDIDPLQLKTICFTHVHADHYMALPQFLLYWRIKTGSLEGLTLVGPAPTIRAAFERAFVYVFHDSLDVTREVKGLPHIVELHDGDTYQIKNHTIEVCDSSHAVTGLCYRITHKPTGHVLGITGDTEYRSEFGTFFQNCDLLVHEASFGAGPINPEANRLCKHSSAQEAVRVAKESGAKQLLLTHSYVSRRMESVAAAQSQLKIPVAWAEPYCIYPY